MKNLKLPNTGFNNNPALQNCGKRGEGSSLTTSPGGEGTDSSRRGVLSTKEQPLSSIDEGFKTSSPLAKLLTTQESTGINPVAPLCTLTSSINETTKQRCNSHLLDTVKSISLRSTNASILLKDASNNNSLPTSARLSSAEEGSERKTSDLPTPPESAEKSHGNERKDSKALRNVDGTHFHGTEGSHITSLMNNPTIQDSSKSPSCLLLDVKPELKENKQDSIKDFSENHPSSIVKIPKVQESSSSPLKNLLKERSMVTKGESAMQSIASVVHIPKNEGTSPLNQLLKSRQSPKHQSCCEKESWNTNLNVNLGNQPSHGKILLESQDGQDGHVLRSVSCASSISSETKDVDLSALLVRKKTDVNSKKSAKPTDVLLGGENFRGFTAANDVKGSLGIQSIDKMRLFDVDEKYGSVLEFFSFQAPLLALCWCIIKNLGLNGSIP